MGEHPPHGVSVLPPLPRPIAAERPGSSDQNLRCGLLAVAATLAPLAAHRALEYLTTLAQALPWGEVAYHTLPPLGMAAAALLLWRLVPPLPGERPARVRGHRALSIAAGLMLGTLAALANLLSVLAGGDAPRATTGEGLEPGVVALVVHVALLAPVAEELAFRGLIYRQIRGLMTPLPATVLSALLFSIMHANLHQAVWALVLGLVAAFAYEQTKSLITPTLIHGLFNAVPIGVAVVRCRPDDVGPLWLVLCAVALIFTVAARGASRSAAAPP